MSPKPKNGRVKSKSKNKIGKPHKKMINEDTNVHHIHYAYESPMGSNDTSRLVSPPRVMQYGRVKNN